VAEQLARRLVLIEEIRSHGVEFWLETEGRSMLIWLRSAGRILLLPYAPRSQNASVNGGIPCALARNFGVIVVPFFRSVDDERSAGERISGFRRGKEKKLE
jgi:hypothetical protein